MTMTQKMTQKKNRKRAWLVALFLISCTVTYYVTVALSETAQMLSASGR